MTNPRTNLRGPFLLMQGLARYLLAKQMAGSIVNILSTSAHVGQSFLTAYSTSKGGLMTLTKNTANALRSNKIRVNAVSPWLDGYSCRSSNPETIPRRG